MQFHETPLHKACTQYSEDGDGSCGGGEGGKGGEGGEGGRSVASCESDNDNAVVVRLLVEAKACPDTQTVVNTLSVFWFMHEAFNTKP